MGGLDRDLQASISKLSDGFSALSAEYKLLAATHQALEGRLQSTQQEAQALRQLLSDKDSAKVAAIPRANTAPKFIPSRSLSEWVEQILKSDSTVTNTSLNRIKEAELACFKIQTQLGPKHRPAVIYRKKSGTTAQNLGSTVMDIEHDFTIPGSPGKLDCPYASMNKHNLPTPKSSDSQCMQKDEKLKTDESQPEKVSSVTSANGSGPCCPIRFLDQRSPEEIAKYFEEHKHELPRSHEVCVKRFQANADSIKELDKKYGNLVNMVKGLGEKHQPMLPQSQPFTETGDAAAENDTGERGSAIKVRKWANTVSDSLQKANGDAAPEDDVDSPDTRKDGEDDRLPRFDRPLKEIRVGESPSRPWGVPIPSKYLDLADEKDQGGNHQTPSEPAAPNREELFDSKLDHKDDQNPVAGSSWLESLDQQRKAVGKKCPIDHETLMKMKKAKTEQQYPTHTQNRTPRPDHKKAAAASETGQSQTAKNVVVNNGTTIASTSSSLHGLHFTNNGTLLLGYDYEQARTFLHGFQ